MIWSCLANLRLASSRCWSCWADLKAQWWSCLLERFWGAGWGHGAHGAGVLLINGNIPTPKGSPEKACNREHWCWMSLTHSRGLWASPGQDLHMGVLRVLEGGLRYFFVHSLVSLIKRVGGCTSFWVWVIWFN
jgi:hypothetical protein